MKKRRVLALLLTLSLAVSTNSMTVFATEAGELTAPVVSPVEESTEDVQDEAEQTDDADDEQDIDSEETEKNDETGGDSAEDQTGNDDDGTNAGEDSDEQTPDVEDEADETVSENELPDEEAPAEEESEELPKVIKHEVRMMTFTDDTGLKITYDANAAANYKYTVENGVLTKVEEANGTDADGNPIWKDVAFTGNVELTQPAGEKEYTSVAASLFSGNKDITYVKLPDGVTSIGDNTFKDCTGLKGVYLPSTVTLIGTSAFESCTSMTQIAVPKAVTAIGNSAFKNDAKLYMVYMKNVDNSALTSIGDSAFEGCTALAEFCSDTEFYIPAKLKSIGEKAFYQCKSIEKADLNTAELETVGASAFEDCTGLKSAVMCKTLAEIPANAFKGCTGLELIKFNGTKSVTVGEYAFYGCYGLKQVELSAAVRKVSQYAFAGCNNLSSVVFKNSSTELETASFPAGQTRDCLVFVGEKLMDKSDKNSFTSIYAYYLGLDPVKIAFVDPSEDNSKEYYTYKVADSNGTIQKDGKLIGGQIWVYEEGKNSFDDNINKLHNGEGVPSGGTYYVYCQVQDGYELVKGSLKSNGETVLQDAEKRYYITMPYGGTVITAEFRQKDVTDKIEGITRSDIKIEFSNGEPIESDGVELKIGQTTRMFLLDKSGKTITTSQIKEISSDRTSVAKVSANGVITAVGVGTAYISVTLIGGDGKSLVVRGMVNVVEAKIASISLKASNYNSSILQITGDADGIQTAAVGKNYARDGLTFTLKAIAYTEERDEIAKELTWKSSDTKVVKLKNASTTSADSSNVVEIQPKSEGEATITVTAKIDSKNTVTQKFVVSVRDQNLKLSSSAVTLNPNLEEQGELEIISAYGAPLPSDANPPKLIEKVGNNWVGNTRFSLQAKPQTEGDIKSGRRRYKISLRDDKLKDGKYTVYVCFDDTAEDSSLPLAITVKRSVPTPTVKFNTTKAKINLFYKNGGTDKDGDPITVTTEVTKLGWAKVKKFELDALTDKEDDQLFLKNFEIDSQDPAKGIVKIRKKNDNLKYTTGKSPKAVVSGYLKIYYEGYRDEVAKTVKVTMPTVTTAPVYVLDRTSVTYRDRAGSQTETLMLLDKKTKEQVTLNSNVKLSVESDESIVEAATATFGSGKIIFDVPSPVKGKIKFFLTNPTEWDRDKNGDDRVLSYTFTVKTTSAEPTIKVNQTVTLNLNYPEVAGTFELKSNQKDTVLNDTQVFTPNSTAKTAAEYDKLEVSYQNGRGTVEIKQDAKVKAGTYKWTCYPDEKGYGQFRKAITLTVKVVDSKPIFKLGKGSLVLNLATATTAADGAKTYGETAEIPLKITGKPEGYMLSSNVNAGDDSTQIECTTKNKLGAAANFDWTLQDTTVDGDGKSVDGKLSVSVKDNNPPSTGTYSFKLTAKYVNSGNGNVVAAKPMTFKVKVDYNNTISVTFSAKGKMNLVDREGEYTAKNTIVYTPTLKNIRGAITDAWIYDANDKESEYFDIYLNPKDGKLYVTPKKNQANIDPGDNTGEETGGETGGGDENGDGNETGGGSVSGNDTDDGSVSGNDTGNGSVSGNDTDDGSVSGNGTDNGSMTGNGDTTDGGNGNSDNNSGDRPSTQSDAIQNYEYAALENNKQYRVKIAVKVAGYNGDSRFHDGIVSKVITIKTAQVLPKVTTDKSTLDVYLSNKKYDATFTVKPQEGVAGIVEEIKFHDDDKVPQEAFDISYVTQQDGSLKVTVHLKEAVAYSCNSINKVKMYIKFKGQGTNTDGTLVNMNIRVNK